MSRIFRLAAGALFAVALAWAAVAFGTTFRIRPDVQAPAERIQAIAINTVLFALFAIHHSVFARPAIRRRVAALVSPDLERSTYVVVSSALFVAVFAAWQPIDGLVWSTTGLPAIALTLLQVAGVALTAYAASRLGALELAGIRPAPIPAAPRATDGKPASDRPLRDTGVYGLVRHPIYLAWLLMVWPAATMTGSRLLFAVLSTGYLVLAIPHEERTLVMTFGAAYRAYQQKVRWRMVPFVY